MHYATVCMKTELDNSREEIKALKHSLKEWKDVWFRQRDITSWLWWNHPAISNDAERAYYQKAKTDEKAV